MVAGWSLGMPGAGSVAAIPGDMCAYKAFLHEKVKHSFKFGLIRVL